MLLFFLRVWACCLLIAAWGFCSPIMAQTYSPKVEAIRNEVKSIPITEAKVPILMNYAKQVYREAPELAKEYARGATVIADKFQSKQKEAYTSRAFIHYTLGEFGEAANFLGRAVSFESNAAKKANLFEKQGNAYLRLKRYNQAVSAFDSARKLYQQAGNKEAAVGAYNSMGEVRFRQKKYAEALSHFKNALPLAQQLNKARILGSIRKNIDVCESILNNTTDVDAMRIESLEVQEKYEAVQATLEDKLDEIARATGELREREQQIMTLKEQGELKDENLVQQKRINDLQKQRNENLVLGGILGFTLMTVILLLSFLLARTRKRRNKELQRKNSEISIEKQRSEELLLSILPAEAAEELKEKGSVTPQEYQQATMLFTDFVGFTRIAESLPADQLIRQLNHVFAAFDDICERHNLEKIKTIGDAYMAAGGIPIPNTTNAEDAVRAALEMQDFLRKWKREKEHVGQQPWELRIGVHTGKVVAGVIGKTKFAYDVWGDTVNIAARMETAGAPWEVNISRLTHELVKDKFVCEHRGQHPIKHKGMVDMYFVKGTIKS